jgi:hypothetical protein
VCFCRAGVRMGGGHTLLYESCPGGGQQEKVLRAAAACPVLVLVLDHRADETTAPAHSPQVKGLPATSQVWRLAPLLPSREGTTHS